jgi:hypothetical protein
MLCASRQAFHPFSNMSGYLFPSHTSVSEARILDVSTNDKFKSVDALHFTKMQSSGRTSTLLNLKYE